MSYQDQERREHPRKKITTRLLWHVIAVSLILLLIAVLVSFWQTYPRAKQDVLAKLQADVQQKLAFNQEVLSGIEYQGDVLSEAFLKRYEAYVGKPEFAELFDDWFQETSPGVFRLQDEFFEGTTTANHVFRHLSTFVGPRGEPLDAELKARIVISLLVLSELAPAWQNEVTNTHFSMPENIISLYSPDSPWGSLADKDLVITDFSTVRSTLQQENPQRTPNWTGLYFDISAGFWTITYQQPVDLAGQHLVNSSFDVSLQQMITDFGHVDEAGVENYLLNAKGHLVASSTLANGIDGTRNTLTPENYDDPLFRALAARLLAADAPIEQAVWEDVDEDYLILVHHFETPNWWYFSVYPKALITEQALQIPLLMAVMGCFLVVILLLAVAFFVTRDVSRPLRELANIAALVNQKNYHAIEQESVSKVRSYGEVTQVLNAFRVMARRFVKANEELEQRIDERTLDLREANQKLEQLAHLDGLTALRNRRAFQKDVAQALQDHEGSYFFVMADIDDFKPFNDNYGHEAGDQALIAISRLFELVAASKTYRYGGEELAILIDAPDAKQVEQRLQELLQSIEKLAIEHLYSRRNQPFLTVSFGYTRIRPGESVSALIQRADKLLYQAKQQGGNCVVGDS
ncbi:diguanylate cyclase [Pseudidiomarina sp. 1APR75-15]|uniref:diguanylate cyclase n=1 Tax=Pseudidiomarina terrestris TaxID=2820060 RepID=A0ABT8MI97_9GAMM|nr:diguanylate cyclase [Pseudidiomarina sp. 1APR75-15]MDN7129651.1 diguanylate cyclase [Pseudidiomarina sp. 1APR75-15]